MTNLLLLLLFAVVGNDVEKLFMKVHQCQRRLSNDVYESFLSGSAGFGRPVRPGQTER